MSSPPQLLQNEKLYNNNYVIRSEISQIIETVGAFARSLVIEIELSSGDPINLFFSAEQKVSRTSESD